MVYGWRIEYRFPLTVRNVRCELTHPWRIANHQSPATPAALLPRECLESCGACQAYQPVQQANHQRESEQAESGIAIESHFLDVQLRAPHTLSLHVSIPLVCDGRYTRVISITS
jgi:hypothetical protein